MPYIATELSVLAYANNFTLWHYATPDDTPTVEAAGYFDKAAETLRVNDLFIINIDTDGTPITKFYIVTANDGASVSISAYV